MILNSCAPFGSKKLLDFHFILFSVACYNMESVLGSAWDTSPDSTVPRGFKKQLAERKGIQALRSESRLKKNDFAVSRFDE